MQRSIAIPILPIKIIGMSNVKFLKMTDNDALSILRDCATDDKRVYFSKHAEQRMVERNITRLQILKCLTKGRITESPYRDVKGDFRLTIEHYTAGNVVSVAVAIKFNDNRVYTVIVTVF
ncbi:MAG: DUF4258 domain-containing protein [Methylomonas sp.]